MPGETCGHTSDSCMELPPRFESQWVQTLSPQDLAAYQGCEAPFAQLLENGSSSDDAMEQRLAANALAWTVLTLMNPSEEEGVELSHPTMIRAMAVVAEAQMSENIGAPWSEAALSAMIHCGAYVPDAQGKIPAHAFVNFGGALRLAMQTSRVQNGRLREEIAQNVTSQYRARRFPIARANRALAA